MKNKFHSVAIIICLILFSCNKEKDSIENSTKTLPKNQNTTYTVNNSPTTIGVEKGKRKFCNQGALKICCGRSWCIVTPLSEYDLNTSNNVENYFQGTIEKVNSTQLKVVIPFNKITASTYEDWFINNIFTAEYFPLSETISNQMGLNNIAISEGSYNVNEVDDVGYCIIVNYQDQIVE
jgi:hypothetical protein